MKIETTIKAIIKEWGISAYNINNGGCDAFATEVIKRMGGYSNYLTDVCTENYVKFGQLAGHYWILYRGKHYDSECPKGVKNWRDLLIFKR